MTNETGPNDVLIIGAGVVGVSAAYYLAQRGARVTLVEQGDICSGSSYGNAGLVVPSHSIPLARPGALGQGLRWMFDPESPFYIKPRLDLDLMSWLWKFTAASRPGPMRRGIPLLLELHRASGRLYDELAEQEDLDFFYERRGLVLAFNTRSGYEDGVEEARLMGEYGYSLEIMDGAAVRNLEPALRPDVLGGVYYREDAHLDPAAFGRALAGAAERLGVCLHTGAEVLGFETADHRVTSVRTTRGDFKPGQVVLAAGAWSPAVARDLRLNLPIQAAKGYSLTFRSPAGAPSLPLLLSEARIAVTPMGPLLRLAGTLEIAGLDMSLNRRRVEAIRRGAPRFLTGVENMELVEIWRGLRPVTPDGLPIVGRAPACENLIVAGGHAMIGQSLGPITGKLVAQMACGEQPEFDLEPLRVERFN